jgi:hypothetical protein
MKSIRTNLHITCIKAFTKFLTTNNITAIVGKYTDNTGFNFNTCLCYTYSEKNIATCENMTYLLLKYGNLTSAFTDSEYYRDYKKDIYE